MSLLKSTSLTASFSFFFCAYLFAESTLFFILFLFFTFLSLFSILCFTIIVFKIQAFQENKLYNLVIILFSLIFIGFLTHDIYRPAFFAFYLPFTT